MNGSLQSFVAPAVLFINEQDILTLEKSVDISAKAIYFHPSVINFVFNLNNIRQKPNTFTSTDCFDVAWLSTFLDADATVRYISLGPSSYNRVNQLFEYINQELNTQENCFWVCRTRSYLLELLIFLKRLPNVIETIELSKNSEDVQPVILYLQNNYQNNLI